MYANDASVVTSTTRGLRCEDTLCDRVIHAGDGDEDEVTTLVSEHYKEESMLLTT